MDLLLVRKCLSSYGGSAYQGGNYGYNSGNPAFARVRMAISQGELNLAEELLNAVGDHNAEWNFLKGTLCYRRGWMDEAKRYLETAVQMEPNNPEYLRALSMVQGGGAGYRPEGYSTMHTSTCDPDTDKTVWFLQYLLIWAYRDIYAPYRVIHRAGKLPI